MNLILEFEKNKFDVSKEDKNTVNPIFGQSLLLWLKQRAGAGIDLSEPDDEDWGWCSDLNWKSRSYLLGAASDDGKTWIFQMQKHRSMKEKILGKEKFSEDDEAWQFFLDIIRSEDSFLIVD